MANTFRKVYKKTGNSGSTSDYQLVGNIGVNGIELDIMKGATSGADGELGLVPKPIAGQEDYLLSGSGVWIPHNRIEIYTALFVDKFSGLIEGNEVRMNGSVSHGDISSTSKVFNMNGWYGGLFSIDAEYYPENSYSGIAMMFKSGWKDGKPIGFMVNAETKSFQYYAAFDTTGYNRIAFSIFYFLKG